MMNKVGIFAGSLLVAFVATYIYSPILGSNADDRAGTSFKATLNVEGVVGIRADVSELNLTSSVGAFVSAPVNVDVASNSQYGYTLSIEDADSNTNMVSTEVSDVVSSNFSGSKTSSTMADNNWGYSIDNTDFYAIPVSGSPVAVKRTDTIMSTTYETTPVYFGVKVGMNLPATTYTDVVKFTAYVNGVDREPLKKNPNVDDNPKITIHDISNMQEMRPTICANTTAGDSETLTDTRDGKTYTVRKLADGKCWMTQNLAIGGNIAMTLHPSDSDIASGFEIPASSRSGFYDQNTKNVYIDSTYGGYYTFYTASAGEGGTDKTSGDVEHSICPKGWRLPTGGRNGESATLYSLYYPTSTLTGDPGLTLSGQMFYGSAYSVGEYGFYWTSTVSHSSNAYYLSVDLDDSDTNNPESYGSKGNGFTIRCVAR